MRPNPALAAASSSAATLSSPSSSRNSLALKPVNAAIPEKKQTALSAKLDFFEKAAAELAPKAPVQPSLVQSQIKALNKAGKTCAK
ncbi:hypothetical protein BCR33DRAFT_710869 [Rhizoclosmatium globosum]|uniref:Uncharacterized protein n=1 Tax=Rhizoclosmatium globosum TaxID=329046 RepID=A0A1Y2D2L3_9FUNG|nr:hypothetical protein BCR33DRAFT_710869 [Rhizoclosmatium globosum]|eukprot:ORY53437.1 hypothetical protein BCR33DRAFT_710869 [Rhizoclosmatium globosum]